MLTRRKLLSGLATLCAAFRFAPTVTTLGLSDAETIHTWQGGVAASSARAGEGVRVLSIDVADGSMQRASGFITDAPLGGALRLFMATERITSGDLVEVDPATQQARLVRGSLNAWRNPRFQTSAPPHVPDVRVTERPHGSVEWTETFR